MKNSSCLFFFKKKNLQVAIGPCTDPYRRYSIGNFVPALCSSKSFFFLALLLKSIIDEHRSPSRAAKHSYSSFVEIIE